MFESLTVALKGNLDELREVINWQEQLREAIRSHPTSPTRLGLDSSALDKLRERAPNPISWKTFDHCAAVGRIYALFEEFVINLVEEYTKFIPKITPRYMDLDEKIRVNHRVGVGHVLTKWSPSKSLYSKIPEADISCGLADGLRGSDYTLLADAFLTDSDNYRPDTLVRLFKKLGFEDAFAFVRKNKAVEKFCAETLNDNETADSFLNYLVQLRNEAAHGDIDQTASAGDIINYSLFCEHVACALAAMLRLNLLRGGIVTGHSQSVAVVKKCFSNNIVGAEASSNFQIKVGDKFYAGSKNPELATVVSLRVHNDQFTEIDLTSGKEFGIQFDRPVEKNSTIFSWHPTLTSS